MNTFIGSIGGSSEDEEVECTYMHSRKMVLMNLVENDLVDAVGEGEGGTNRETALARLTLSVKQLVGSCLLSNTGSFSLLLCDDLKGWDGERGGRIREKGYINYI